MKHSRIFLLQIILLSIASSDGAHMLDEPQDATKLIVLEPTTGKQWFLGPILVDFKLGALGACQHWSSATMPLQKPLSHASHSRHATTAMKERSDIFLLQIILLSIASNDGAHMLDEPQDATKLIVLEPTTGKQWFLGPILVDFKLGALGACQHWSSATMPLQKPLSHASHSRHATTAMKERSDIFLLQQNAEQSADQDADPDASIEYAPEPSPAAAENSRMRWPGHRSRWVRPGSTSPGTQRLVSLPSAFAGLVRTSEDPEPYTSPAQPSPPSQQQKTPRPNV
ncbi:hypothetical protein ISCGN_003142 [Ixodes scapularis]